MGQEVRHFSLPLDDKNSAAVTTDAVGSGHLAATQGPQLCSQCPQLDRVPNLCPQVGWGTRLLAANTWLWRNVA